MTGELSSTKCESVAHHFRYGFWVRLAISMVLITPLSLGVHEIMLEGFHVPPPPPLHLPCWGSFLNTISLVAGLAFICKFAEKTPRSLPRLCILVGCAFIMLNETLRVYFIDVALSKAWLFQGLKALPQALYLFLLASTVAVVVRRVRRPRTIMVLLISTGALFSLVLHPASDRLTASLLTSMGRFDYPQLYFEPFPMKIFVPIYTGYLEPVAATFVFAWLVWPRMTTRYPHRLLWFVLMIMLLKNSILSLLLWSFWIPGKLISSVLSEAQFSVEVLVLALLTGIAWEWLLSRTREQQDLGSPQVRCSEEQA